MQEVLDKLESLSVKDASCIIPEINIYKKILLPAELLNMYPEFLEYVLHLCIDDHSLIYSIYTAVYQEFTHFTPAEKFSMVKKYIKHELNEDVQLDYILTEPKNAINIIIISDYDIKIKYIAADKCCILYKKSSIYYLLKKKGGIQFSQLCNSPLIIKLFSQSIRYNDITIKQEKLHMTMPDIKQEKLHMTMPGIKQEKIHMTMPGIKQEKIHMTMPGIKQEVSSHGFGDMFDEVVLTLDKWHTSSYDVKMTKLMRLKLDALRYACNKRGLSIYDEDKHKYYSKKVLCKLILE